MILSLLESRLPLDTALTAVSAGPGRVLWTDEATHTDYLVRSRRFDSRPIWPLLVQVSRFDKIHIYAYYLLVLFLRPTHTKHNNNPTKCANKLN